MAWTAPRTWVAGEVVTAAIGNTHWRDQFNFVGSFLSTGTMTTFGLLYGSGTNPIGVMAALTTGQVAIGATAGTAAPTAIAVFESAGGAMKGTYGGLNANVSTAVPGAILYSTTTGTFAASTAGTSGQLLESQGTGTAPRWVNAGALSVVRAGSGTTTSTILDTATLSNLSGRDMVLVAYQVKQIANANVAGPARIEMVGGAATSTLMLCGGNNTLGLSTQVYGRAFIAMGSSTAEWHAIDQAGRFGGLGNTSGVGTVFLMGGTNLATSWTGTWTIQLLGIPGGGDPTFDWNWKIWRLIG